jgi:hypothetical protein
LCCTAVCVIIWLLRSIILLLCSVVWRWNLIKLWCMACPVIISAYTLYASDVLSRINSIVLQSLSSWPTDLQKVQYELFGTVWYFCIIGSDMGRDPGFLQTSHHSPPVGNGFGILAAIYCVNVGHSFLWCPSVLHVVHQTTSHLSLFLFWLSWNVKFFKSSFSSSIVGSIC